jgi:hypothetical protein
MAAANWARIRFGARRAVELARIAVARETDPASYLDDWDAGTVAAIEALWKVVK